eukprot:564367-Pyramimonas_sp.AAC.1
MAFQRHVAVLPAASLGNPARKLLRGTGDDPRALAVARRGVVLGAVAVLAEIKGDNHHVLAVEERSPPLGIPDRGVDPVGGWVLGPSELLHVESLLESSRRELRYRVACDFGGEEGFDAFWLGHGARPAIATHPRAEAGAHGLETDDVHVALADVLEEAVLHRLEEHVVVLAGPLLPQRILVVLDGVPGLQAAGPPGLSPPPSARHDLLGDELVPRDGDGLGDRVLLSAVGAPSLEAPAGDCQEGVVVVEGLQGGHVPGDTCSVSLP